MKYAAVLLTGVWLQPAWVSAAGPTPGAFAPTLAQRRIEVGDSFLYTLEVKGQIANLTQGTHLQRYAGFSRNSAGGLILELDGGPKRPEPYIHQLGYSLAADACVADLGSGTALLTGTQCAGPLPTEEWTVQGQNRLIQHCKVEGTQGQQISVPAGAFATTEIRCTSEPTATGARSESVYWYSALIGAMVKAVRRRVDGGGKEVWSISDQLQAYEPGPHQ